MTATEKLMVMNIYKNFYKNWPHETPWSLEACAAKTAETTGISAVTVRRILHERKTTGAFSRPKKPGPKKTFKDKCDEYAFGAIRRIVHKFFQNNECPTLQKVNTSL